MFYSRTLTDSLLCTTDVPADTLGWFPPAAALAGKGQPEETIPPEMLGFLNTLMDDG